MDSSNYAVIWMFDITGTSSEWTNIQQANDVSTLLIVGSSHLFITVNDETAANKPAFIYFEWGSTSPVWAKNQNWTGNACGLDQGAAVLSSDGSIIYSLISLGTLGTGFLQEFEKSNGAVTVNRFETNAGNYGRGLGLELKSGKLYWLLGGLALPYLFVYDTASNIWTDTLQFSINGGILLENNQADL